MNKEICIFIIEDDPDLGTMIKLMLETKTSYVVTVLEKAEQAVEIIRNNSIDLVIMDMLLSGANGVDICTVLKQDDETTHIPVLMISAHPTAEEVCLAAGADDFISKPFDMQGLLSKVNMLINEKLKV